MYSTCPSREVDHFLGWTASRSGTVVADIVNKRQSNVSQKNARFGYFSARSSFSCAGA